MRIAFLSDVHGNLVSLEAVLADLARQRIDEVIFLGDLATMGPQPLAVIDRIRELGCECIIGNHELYLLEPERCLENPDAPAWLADTVGWCYNQLSRDELDFFASFKPMIEITLGDDLTLLCVHGSPRSPFDFLLAQLSPAEVDAMMDGFTPTIMACGHTHVQMMRQHNGILIMNSGSVGAPFLKMPFERTAHYMPWAEYGILDVTRGVINMEMKRIPIDVSEIVAPAIGNSHVHIWASSWPRQHIPQES